MIRTSASCLLLACALGVGFLGPRQAHSEEAWPHPIPCRVEDGDNDDLFILALGDLFTKLKDWGCVYYKIDGQPIVVNEYPSANAGWRGVIPSL